MRTHRAERVGSLIQSELGKILLRDIDLPEADGKHSVLTTISRVEVSKDLSAAKVFVGILPESITKEVFTALKKEQGECQYLLNRRMNIKPMPRIDFVLDEGLGKASKIEKIFIDGDNDL